MNTYKNLSGHSLPRARELSCVLQLPMHLLGNTVKSICLILLLFAATLVNAANYYVSPSGNDSYTAAQAQNPSTPWKTIQRAADATNPGDVVYIMEGTYTRGYEGLNIRRSGSASGGYITYRNYPGHTPVIYMPKARGNWQGIQISEGVSYIIIDGLTIKGDRPNITLQEGQAVHDHYKTAAQKDWDYIATTNTNGIYLKGNKGTMNGVHHIIIRNCHIYDFPGAGIASEIIDYVTVENNRVHSNCWYMIWAGSGISVFHPYNSDNNTTDFKIIVRNNITYNNETKIMWADKNIYSDGNGIIIDDTKNGQISRPAYTGKTLVVNNISFDNGGSGIQAFSSENVWMVNNTAYLNSRSPHLNYGNISAHSCRNVHIYNNISYVRSGEPTNLNSNNVDVYYNYNIYYNGLAPAAKGLNDIIQDPLFVNASTVYGTADFRLQLGSPARNSGTTIAGVTPTIDNNGTARPQGAAIDRGAYECTEPSVVPQAPYSGTAIAIPGLLEPENFDNGGEGVSYHDSDATNSGGQYRNEGVDITTSTDGNYKVGWIATGEWLEYTVNVAAAGYYNIATRISSGNTSGGSFNVELNGTNISGTISAPSTGSWNTFTTVNKEAYFNAGQQVLRIYIVAGGFDISSMHFTRTNLLTNVGFENGTTPWTCPNCALTQASSQVKSGSYAGSVTSRTAYWAGPRQTITGTLTANGQGNYNLSAWLRKETGSCTGQITIKLTYGGTNYYKSVSGSCNSTGWTNVSGMVSLTWSGTLTSAEIYVETPGNQDNFFVDDISLIKSTATARSAEDEAIHVTAESKEDAFSFYPNPVKDRVTVRVLDGASKKYVIQLISSEGINLIMEKMTADEHQLSLEHLPQGLYFIRLNSSARKKYWVQKIFKQ